MKKILHISKYYYPFVGGVEQTARDCVNALMERYEQKVICFNHLDRDKIEYIDGVEIVRCSCQCKIASQSVSISMIHNLKQLMDEFDPDYVVFHYPNPYVAHFLLKYIKANNRMILYWHLDITRQKVLGKCFYHQNLRLINQAYKIVATSPNYIEGSLFLSCAKKKCVVIPSCINTKRLQITEKIEKQAKKIRIENKNKTLCIAVGRHVPYKGFEYLIEASKYVKNSFEFYIIGDGELTDKLKSKAANNSKIHFLGRIEDDYLKAYLLACDIFCFPSITKNEAFGLALAEGMYFGKPAVTFTIPGSGVNYVNLDGITGIECPNRDSKAYADALNMLGENETLRQELGINAKRRVVENFTEDRYEINIRRLFNDDK